ncbi:flavoprotein [Rhodococcus sp. BP-252]|uniref:nitric oxide dioxygenase n=1 Tax=Rhodococcoides kyotonense TaxID=398843 RepID=A0A177YLQ3_9NOCA|nr:MULTISPECIES: globin domain-containing protein [Rhodococcus]MBY6412658.1 flavoprotein [Rhodococcus sp. BP-320]MBY6417087.1 flavoprotein [Rhodococcus sp. BP-321]MBY6423175.1 flavoprotein [Rhodococcus sp. BP-324]MBY6427111.1 flavoprotein [Rhodococcus sp. BP-323]MBY6432276.1 flavoprotein [Rhodococcus sp. BP-322]
MLDARTLSLVRAGFKAVLAADDGPERLARSFYAHLFAEHPEFRAFFPAAMDQQRERFVKALAWVFDNLDRDERVVPFLEQLGRDHRKHGVDGSHLRAGSSALTSAFRTFVGNEVWTDEIEAAWTSTLDLVSGSMAVAADSDEMPPYWGATVVDHQRLLDDLAVVRLQLDESIPYFPGQYVSVQIPQRPKLWRYLSPAIPSNPQGEIEFHVRRVSGGWVSPAIVGETVVGDRWAVSPPLGGLHVDRSIPEDVLMIAGGTGLAPLRAQIMDMARMSRNPRVHLFMSGIYPRDLYDAQTMWQLSLSNPWLTVVPVTEENEDPWWHASPTPELPVGMHHRLHGPIGKVVTQFGSWADRRIQVCGSPSMVRTTLYALRKVGTPMEHVQHDPL